MKRRNRPISCLPFKLAFKTDGTLVPILRFAFFGIAAACLVTTMTLTPMSQKILIPRSVLLLENASYSLYLTHVFTLPAMLLVLHRMPFDLPAWATISPLFAASVLIAMIFYVVFEKPSQRFSSSTPDATN
ncbi:acyltransferase [Antarcticimicrobium sediminis]|uniref:Acyltransferase n=1 Tax=Antarcticimicrobium sediminis TaxID=2546227 RepID=A0A4R5EHF7_9RHOB|nr:acyltransferase [Antarcticimicrobium sediminis]TDE33713.1 acyltransferase [Antarcticimicrobium sediminis]